MAKKGGGKSNPPKKNPPKTPPKKGGGGGKKDGGGKGGGGGKPKFPAGWGGNIKDYGPGGWGGSKGPGTTKITPPGSTTPPPEDEVPEDELPEDGESVAERREREERERREKEERDRRNADTRVQLEAFVRQYFKETDIPEIMGFIDSAIANDKSYNAIILELRNTPVYKRNFPEHEMRKKNGHGWMAEADIIEYRQTIKRIAKQLSGVDLDTDPQSSRYLKTIGKLIAGDVDPGEWANRLETWEQFSQWGPTVRGVLEEELGRRVPDDEAFMFMSQDFATPELDRAYENALYRGRPAVLGLGVRGSAEAELLRQYGIDVDQAFRGYQAMLTGGGGVAGLARTEQIQALDAEIHKGVQIGNLPGTGSALFNDTPFSLLFRAIQLNDQDAIAYLQNQMNNEISRFRQGGGVVSEGTQAVGLLSPDQRRAG